MSEELFMSQEDARNKMINAIKELEERDSTTDDLKNVKMAIYTALPFPLEENTTRLWFAALCTATDIVKCKKANNCLRWSCINLEFSDCKSYVIQIKGGIPAMAL